MDQTVAARVRELDLAPHPEGGFFRETHRSSVRLPDLDGYPGQRVAVTSILYLLPGGSRSRWHRVRSEELWLSHEGDPLHLRTKADLLKPADREQVLGPGADVQAFVAPGHWQHAEAAEGPHGYALVGCVVAPGFEFEDFESLEQ